LAQHIRTEDGCARWGGEEFLVSLPHTDQHRAAQVAEKLRTVIANLDIRYRDEAVPVTISLGVSTFEQSHGLDDIIRAADKALLRAKEHGKNRVEIGEET
jgi:diguanylate cyclase (GGDEF)-like protein